MEIKHYYDETTGTLSYLIFDTQEKIAAVIDPILDFDPAKNTTKSNSINKIANDIKEQALELKYILETHVHADHISGAYELKKIFPTAQIAISDKITSIQKTFAPVFDFKDFKSDGSQFDLLLEDNQEINLGKTKIKIIQTPGHTPACACFLIKNHLFTGDTMFMPDFGTGRCDFPEGSAELLYHSIKTKIYTLDEEVLFYVGHDYKPNKRELKFRTTIKDAKENNKHLTDKTTKEEFLNFRLNRDKELSAPKLLFQSLQININAGKIITNKDGAFFFKIPAKQIS